jgi:tetratricopeptide (TPR) repeat protein
MSKERFRNAAREFEQKARDAVALDEKIDLYGKASLQYYKAGDSYACEMLVSAASEAIKEGEFEKALDLHMDAGKLSYELGSDDIFWYLDMWWVAKKLGKIDELSTAIEKTLKRAIERATNQLAEENNSDAALDYANRVYGLAANYHKTKMDFDGYLLNVEKAIGFLPQKSVVDAKRIAHEYSLVANNVYLMYPLKAVDLFNKAISYYEKIYGSVEIKEAIYFLREDLEKAKIVAEVKLPVKAIVHPVLLEYMFKERSTDPFSVLGAIAKDAYDARQSLKYVKFLESEKLNVILGETYLFLGNLADAKKSYMRAVESLEYMFYFEDLKPEEYPREIKRVFEYNTIAAKIECVLNNPFVVAEHYCDAGENMRLLKDYATALECYEMALKYASDTNIPREKWDHVRRSTVEAIEEKMNEVKALMET